MHFCRIVILLSRGEFFHERNKISNRQERPWTFCYMSNSWYNVILQQILILRNSWCKRSYCAFNLGYLNQFVNATPRLWYLFFFFWKYLLKNSPFTPSIFVAHLQKNTPVICYNHIQYILTHSWYIKNQFDWLTHVSLHTLAFLLKIFFKRDRCHYRYEGVMNISENIQR